MLYFFNAPGSRGLEGEEVVSPDAVELGELVDGAFLVDVVGTGVGLGVLLVRVSLVFFLLVGVAVDEPGYLVPVVLDGEDLLVVEGECDKALGELVEGVLAQVGVLEQLVDVDSVVGVGLQGLSRGIAEGCVT